MRYLLQLLFLTALLTTPAQAEPTAPVVAGLEMGRATWRDLAHLDSKKTTLQRETPSFPQDDLGVAHLTGPLSGKLSGEATLYFDSDQVLTGAVITAPKGQAVKFLVQFAKQARAKETERNRFARGDWVLALVSDANGTESVQLATPAFAQKMANRAALLEAREAQQARVFQYGKWFLAALAAIGLAFVAGPPLFKRRRGIYEHALVGLVSLSLLTSLYSLPSSFSDVLIPGLTLVGLWIAVQGALRMVIASGWIPVKNFYLGAVLATLALPFVIVPLVVRNMVKSLPYATCVLLMLTITSIAYLYWQPSLIVTLRVLPLFALLSGGVVRIASVSFEWAQKRVPARLKLLSVPLALMVSPVTALAGLAMGALSTLAMVFSPLLIVQGLCLVAVTMFDGHWIPVTITSLLGLFMLSPILAPAVMPTGVSGLDFSSQGSSMATSFPTSSMDFGGTGDSAMFGGFNPANGMPLLDGTGGMDVFGNSFGSSLNDPF